MPRDGSAKSGRFALRMSPALHAALDSAARTAGLSLNAYCVQQLERPGLGAGSDRESHHSSARPRRGW